MMSFMGQEQVDGGQEQEEGRDAACQDCPVGNVMWLEGDYGAQEHKHKEWALQARRTVGATNPVSPGARREFPQQQNDMD